MAWSVHSGPIGLQTILVEVCILSDPQQLHCLLLAGLRLAGLLLLAQIATVDHPSASHLLGPILMLGPTAGVAIAARWSRPYCSILTLLGPSVPLDAWMDGRQKNQANNQRLSQRPKWL